MSFPAYIKAGDLRPVLRLRLTEDDTPVDLTGCSAVLRARDRAGTLILDVDLTIDEAASGLVSYTFLEADTATPCQLDCEVTVTDADLKPATYPQDGYFTIIIAPSLAPVA